MEPSSIRSAPIHNKATLDRFTSSVTAGNTAAMSRAARNDDSVRRWLASAKRALSTGSRVKARTTRTPVICSRSTVLIRSMRSCICWNAGFMATMIEPATKISRGTTTSNSTDKPASSRMASTVPAIMVSGAVIIMIVTSAVNVWIW